MMNTMRRFASGFVSKLLLCFLVITFVIWGVGDIIRNGGIGYAARVGSDTITVGEFQQQKQRIARQMEAMGMRDIDPNTLDVSILRQLVQQHLLVLAMHDLGFYVNDALLTKTLRTQPAFQNKDGSFSSTAFRATARAEHMGEAAFLNQLADEAAGQFLMTSLDMSGVVPPLAVRALAASTALETRDAWIVTIAPTSAPAAIDEAALTTFYEKNKSVLYVQPESRTLEYVTLKPAQIDALVDRAVTDAMVADAAKAEPATPKTTLRDRLRSDQRERVLHDLQGAMDDALAGGASLSDALTKAGLPTQMHTLENVTDTTAKTSTDDVTKTVAEQGLVLGEGETSGLIVTPHGIPVITHVKTVRSSTPLPYAQVAADVRAHVGEQMRRDNARLRVQEVKEALNALHADPKAQPTDKQLQAVLTKFNLNARHASNLTRPTAMKLAQDGIPASLHQAIFERQVGTVAGPMTLDNGGQMVAIVTAIHHPPTTQKENASLDKPSKDLSEALNKSVQMHAFALFAKHHPVTLNPQLLAPAQPADNAQ